MNEPQQHNASQSENREETGGSAGPMIGIVVVIVLLVAGALYVWKTKVSEVVNVTPPAPIDTATSALETMSTSTELDDIDADLQNTDIESLDSDMGAVLYDIQQ